MANDSVQRNAQWFADRCGIPTASRYKDLMANPRAKKDIEAGLLSDGAMSYIFELVASRLGSEKDEFSTAATQWGNDNEHLAIDEYQERTGNEVLGCGFVKHPTIKTGASPDGVIGLDGCIEVKCPFNGVNHIRNAYTREVSKEYLYQVHGQMWVLETEWNDFVSFDPRIESKERLSIVRVNRDEKIIAEIEAKVTRFNEKLEEVFEQLIQQ